MAMILFAALSACTGSAEELSEHLMTAVSGTQISGYVSGSFVYLPGIALATDRPTHVSVYESLSQTERAPLDSFNPLDNVSFPKVPDPNSHGEGSYSIGVDVGSFVGDGDRPRDPGLPDSMSVGFSSVPEPGTIGFLALGAAGGWWWMRRRKIRA